MIASKHWEQLHSANESALNIALGIDPGKKRDKLIHAINSLYKACDATSVNKMVSLAFRPAFCPVYNNLEGGQMKRPAVLVEIIEAHEAGMTQFHIDWPVFEEIYEYIKKLEQ